MCANKAARLDANFVLSYRGRMNTEATATVTLPGNRANSVPDITITDDDGTRQTLWDFTAWASEYQTLKGAAQLLCANGWRPSASTGDRQEQIDAAGRAGTVGVTSATDAAFPAPAAQLPPACQIL